MARSLGASILVAASLVLASCSVVPDEPPRLESTGEGTAVRPDLALTAATAPRLSSDALDIYATDLPIEAGGSLPPDASGHLLHLHLFLVPTGGKTPIDPEASSASVRWIILAGGEVGIYGGGGLVVPETGMFGGGTTYEIRQATLELLASTPGFNDRLGPSRLSGTLSPPVDRELTGTIAAKIEEAVSRVRRGEE